MSRSFIVQRDNLRHFETIEDEAMQASDGEVIIGVDRFALTANNVTYAVAGDTVGYWQFFPAPKGMGRIPVWGIGKVLASAHPNIQVEQRYYGYYPMSGELLVQPGRVSPRGFTDATAHRADLPLAYNQYSLMTPENGFDPAFDNHQILYRPLAVTSYALADYLGDNDNFGASQIVLSSASSKTAFGLASMLRGNTTARVVGLTSSGNLEFVRRLGLYDDALTYDDAESLADEPTTYVDMSGNRELRHRIHHHLKDQLLCDCGVGITHWESPEAETQGSLPGAKPTMFFAPTQILKRNEELGVARNQANIAVALDRFYRQVDNWVTITEHPFSEVETVFRTVLEGPPPNQGYVVTMN